MALPSVNVEIQNGGLGLVSNPDDRVVGLVLNGIGFQNTPFLQPKQLFSLKDFDDYMTASSMSGEYPNFARAQVADFYSVAGTGAELWIMFVDNSVVTPTLFTNSQVASFLDAASGRLNVVAISRYNVGEDVEALTMLDGLLADCLNAMDEAQALAVDYANQHKPVRFILDGRYLASDLTTLRNLKTHTYNRVSICVASTSANSHSSCLGLLLGRIAACPVNRNIGRVKDGSVPTSEAYLTSGSTVKAFGNKAITLNDKGYIFLRQFVGKAGFYWNDDHTATADTDDFFSLANGRVIDKAARIIYTTFVEEVLETVPVDEKGRIVKTVLKQYQEKAERAIGLTMGAAGEISFVECFIDPSQDILATSELKIDVRITPTGTNRIISITLGLFNPNVTA